MSHEAVQARRWARADPAHFDWQTALPYAAAREAALLADLGAPGGRLLEVGCGEGGNLFHLRGRARALFGVDRYPAKAAFARGRGPDLRLAVADAARLPFRDGSFEAVLLRDVLHHVERREVVVAEAWRVLAPGGALAVVEANVTNPLVLAQAAAVPAERGLLRSTPGRIARELEGLPGRGPLEVRMAQPLPLERVLLNPGFGRPALACSPLARGALGALERLAGAALPRRAWAYVVARTTKEAGR
ncbi:MAG: class I SAM-dependent methyltransferase [Planctomycetes bacterium]|nr:class I SAM-dependent methyltransferase [Planctomycetota bacterium]